MNVKVLGISIAVIMFLAGMMAANPEASAANPVLTFLQNTVVPLLEQILALQEQTLQEVKCGQNDYCPPAGLDLFETIAEVELDLGPLGQGTVPLVGEVTVQRSEPDTTGTFQTEMISMSLSGSHPSLGDVTLKAGRTFGLPPSTGAITPISPDSTFPATSFFDVFVEIEIRGLQLRSVEPLRIQTDDRNPVKEIPPFETPFIPLRGVPLVGPDGEEILGRIGEGSVFVPTTPSQAIIKKEIIDLKKDLTDIKDTLGGEEPPPPPPPPPVEGQCSDEEFTALLGCLSVCAFDPESPECVACQEAADPDGQCVGALEDLVSCGLANGCSNIQVEIFNRSPSQCTVCSCEAEWANAFGTPEIQCGGTTCDPGLTACGSLCVDTTNNPQHCGGCNVACGQGEACIDGQCNVSCQPGQVNCGGVCTHLSFDPNNCGFCGNACAPGEACINGQCGT